ncbi:MAG TPA: uroporphyrinogen-III synthase, partial [Polyangiaceae bacterium]|nr:uroporphyrinogen-III synthase [Polyangiaceae bacterium]
AVVAEAIAVSQAGIPIEVVPGVGTRAAAAAFAGVVGRAVAVRADEVARFVAGEPPDTPVTLIAGIGTPRQRTVVTTAGDAAERAGVLGIDTAVVLAFGAPVSGLGWFERRPLFGRRVLVTRARAQAAGTAELLQEYGAEPVVVPTIEIRPPADPAPLAAALARLRAGGYAWVAFTSANGVEMTWNALSGAGRDARAFGSARLAAIGPATARALEGHGLRPDVVAAEFRGEGLAHDLLEALSEERFTSVLIARAARARDVLPDALRAAGHRVDVAPAYETHPPPHETVEALARELDLGRIDAVTFTSSSTVENLCDLLGSSVVELLRGTRVASIGPITTASAQARGVRVDVTARTYTVPGLIEALAESFRHPWASP